MVLGALIAAATLTTTPTGGRSFYTVRFEDPKAVYLTAPRFHVHADGVGDDTDAIQDAIDAVQETTGQGVLFIPEGHYRLSKTLSVWPGVRLIGYGAKRPLFLLAPNTPGYQDTEKYMVFFGGRRTSEPGELPEQPVVPVSAGRDGGDFGVSNDASPGTFYSGMSNIDLEIGDGNPAAVGIRGRYAQHCLLEHMDFRVGSGLAGIHDIGNIAEDLRFFGGQYGIITRTPSPGWQFTLIDSHFEGQEHAAIRCHETGLTLIRPSFSNVPTAISVEPNHTEQLWIKDGRMSDISGPAIQISRENSLRTQINIEGLACSNVPIFAELRESKRQFEGKGAFYDVRSFSHGLTYAGLGSEPRVTTLTDVESLPALPPPSKTDGPDLPASEDWVNLRSLGAKGDNTTDDTAAIQAAIDAHHAIYVPSGKYKVTHTIHLRPDTVLIGLHPFMTQFVVADGTPAFMGIPDASAATSGSGRRGGPRSLFPGGPVPLLETAKGGGAMVSGIGLDTGGNNLAAVAAKWCAGAESMIADVKFLGGHGSGIQPYNADHTGDPNPERKWDSQYPSLWVTDGGGGTFKNIWTASTFAQAGMSVTNTSTSGRVYQLSSEHHVRNELVVRGVSNWSFYAVQTEEERGEGPFALPLEIQDSSNITVANLNMYRVVSVSQPFPCAIRVSSSKDIRFRGVHCYSNSKASFDNLLIDGNWGYELRQREFAFLNLTGSFVPSPRSIANVEKLATGFFNISGGAVHPNGDFYFVDARWNRIYRWDAAARRATLVSDSPLSPTNMVFDKSGNLMLVSYAGKGVVYSFHPGHGESITLLKPEPTTARPGATAALPVTDWILHEPVTHDGTLSHPFQVVSPDGSVFLPVGQDFVDGALTWGVKLQDVIRTFGLSKAEPGKPFYMTGESDMRTYAMTVGPDGSVSNSKLFAEQGGEGVAVDPHGNVYIAAGQIYVYSPDGRRLGTIDVPERPTQLAFGGRDGKTLFITARTSLYSVRVR